MTKSIKWGIIGPGRIAQKFADALNRGASGQLWAVASRDLSKAKDFAQNYGAQRAYGDYAQLLADSDVDAIYLATPHNYHYPLACQVLAAGKHLLVEKPVCMNLPQTQRLVTLAQQHQCFLMEAMWSRFLPACLQAQSWLQAGEIGRVHSISSSIGFAFHRGNQHRTVNMDLAGGALLDLGVYSVALTNWLLEAEPTELTARAHLGETGADYTTLVQLSYPAGQLAQFATSVDTDMGNNLVIHGEQGRIELEGHFWGCQRVHLQQKNQTRSLHLPFEINGFEYQIRAVEQAILASEQQSAGMPWSAMLTNMRTMDEIRRQIGLHYASEFEAI